MGNPTSVIDFTVTLTDFLATAVSDGTWEDILDTLKFDEVGEEAAASQIDGAGGQLWSNMVDDFVLTAYMNHYQARKVWRAANLTGLQAYGSDDDLDVDAIGYTEDTNSLYYCTAVSGPSTSTWSGLATAPETLAATLTAGNVTDNQPIKGTNAATQTLSNLSLIAGTPTGSGEDGGLLTLTGGQGSATGSAAGGSVLVQGGTPRLGLSILGGAVFCAGADAADSTQGGGQAEFRGGDDDQGALTNAGAATFRGGDTTGNRNGATATFRGGHAGDFSATVGGQALLEGGDGGNQGTGGTGGNTGPVIIETQDFTATEFTGTGTITIRTGIADHAGSNAVGSVNISCGKSGSGTGNPGAVNITAGENTGTDNAGAVNITGGEHSGSNTYDGGPVAIAGGASTAGDADGGGISLTVGAGSGTGVDGNVTLVGPTGGTATFNGESGKLTLPGELEIDGDLNHDGTNVGFYNVTPIARPSAYTQTYSTADKTLGAYTPDDESGSYTGIDNAQGGTPYAQVTDLNALRTAYENLRAFVEDAVQMLNAVVDDQQSLGLAQ
jgi:hypothetical protein